MVQKSSSPQIDFLDTNANFLSRYTDPSQTGPYDVRAAFGFGWDALNRKTGQAYSDPAKYPRVDHFHTISQARSTPGRQVITSNEHDFFADFEARYGATLPSQCVTFGNEWDLYSASMAETSAQVRRSVEKLRSAEAMATLVSLHQPAFMSGRESARDLAFQNLGLYWEHDWTADGPVSRSLRAAWQELIAGEIATYVESLHADAASRLGGMIQKSGGNTRFYVFNPLSWVRTDAADLPYAGPPDIHVFDLAAATDTPHQIVTQTGATFLRILANDLPSVGYKAYEIRGGPGTAASDHAATVGNGNTMIENNHVKIFADPDGAIASLIDKSNGNAQLAATIGGLKINDFAANGTAGDNIVVENSGPVSVTLKCVSTVGVDHTTRITLYRNSSRLDLRNEITENFSDVRHWTYSFNITAPDVHTEEIGAVIRAKRKADGGDYADALARTDYLTLNHFADISNGGNTLGVTLSNADCAFARLGNSTMSTLDTATPQLSILAGGQVDGPNLGITNQDGARRFLQRFALLPHAGYDQATAMKFALEHQNPPVASAITGSSGSPYPETSYSYLTLSNPGVILWALKPHDDGIGSGIVARVWNQNSAPSKFTLAATTGKLANARNATHIETGLNTLALSQGLLPAQRMQSYIFNAGVITGPNQGPGILRNGKTPALGNDLHQPSEDDWWLPDWVKPVPNSGIYGCYGEPPGFLDVKGVVLPWKTLEPTEGAYDWSILKDTLAKGQPVWLRFFASDVSHCPAWLHKKYPDLKKHLFRWPTGGYDDISGYIKGKETIRSDGEFHEIWDPRFEAEFRKLLQEFSRQGFGRDPRIRFVYFPHAFRWNEYSLKWVPEMTRAGFTPEAYVAWFKRTLADYIAAFDGDAGWIVYSGTGSREWVEWTGEQASFDRWDEAINLPDGGNVLSRHCLESGCGVRDGFTEAFNHFSWRPDWGLDLVKEGDFRYSVINEKHPLIRSEKRFFGTENEDFSYLLPGVNSYHWNKLATLNMLRLRMNWAFIGDYRMAPELYQYMRRTMGRNVQESPDAWAALRQSGDSYLVNDQLGDGKENIRNYERWLYQREVAEDGRTVATQWVQPRKKFAEMNGGSWEALRTDHANGSNFIYFNVDDIFLKGGRNAVQLKITYLDDYSGEWWVEYDAGADAPMKKSHPVRNTADGKWKTITISVDDASFENRQHGWADFRISNGGMDDLTVRFVRLIKMTPPTHTRTP